MKEELESVIVSRIVDWIRKSGYSFVYKTHGSAYQRSGLPDITMIDKNGRYVGLECKRPHVGRLTLIQAKTLNAIAMSGGYAAIVTSVEEAARAISESEAGTDVEPNFHAGGVKNG